VREISFAVATGIVSWLLVGAFRHYAKSRGVLDHPSSRSSHGIPTPRGGGAGLLIAAVLGFIALTDVRQLDWRLAAALVGLLITAVTGWIDDHRSLSVRIRFSAHLLSGVLLMLLAIDLERTSLGLALQGLAWTLATVSAINVVNFMDGIDGLIGLQAFVFGTHVALLAATSSLAAALGLALAASSVGFLIWNRPPSRIFLGDVGSGGVAMLGLTAGILVWRDGAYPVSIIFLPLVPIFLDASVAIVRRWRRGERLTTAHRTHLYQRLANEAGWGHARVSALFGISAALAMPIMLFSGKNSQIVASLLYGTMVAVVGAVLDRYANRQANTA
jgi:Fuc2NAc and GlcNAc transferase